MSVIITKETSFYHLLIGILIISAGIYLASPVQFHWVSAFEALDLFGGVWYRIVGLFIGLSLLSIFLATKGCKTIAQFAGSFAFMTLTYPALFMVSVLLPEEMGYEALMIVTGFMHSIVSFCVLMAVLLLREFESVYSSFVK